MIHRVEHIFQDRMLLPMLAVENNIDFLCRRDAETRIECLDGKIAKVKFSRTIHALSEEFDELLQKIYGREKKRDLLVFLKRWYDALEHKYTSLEFIYIETYGRDAEKISD